MRPDKKRPKITCPNCKGVGQIKDGKGGWFTCTLCMGKGKIDAH